MSKFKVLGARCVIKKDNPEEQTKGGVILSSKAREEVYSGVVISVGQGHYTETGAVIPMTVKAGDNVIFAKFAGAPIKSYDDDKNDGYLVLNERDIIAIIEEDAKE